MALDEYKWVEGALRRDIEQRMEKPIFERTGAGVTNVCYPADTPEGWIQIDYDPAGFVSNFGFTTVPPWEEGALGGTEIIIPFTGLDGS